VIAFAGHASIHLAHLLQKVFSMGMAGSKGKSVRIVDSLTLGPYFFVIRRELFPNFFGIE
jgi:hypothetical protein